MYLAAVEDTQNGHVGAFVYLYRAPNFGPNAFEISYAKNPDARKGIVTTGVIKTLMEFNNTMHMQSGNEPHIKIISRPWIDKFKGEKPHTKYQRSRAVVVMNPPSIKLSEAVGFVRYKDSDIWRLDWHILYQKAGNPYFENKKIS